MPPVPEYTLPAELAHTALAPVTLQVGKALTVTVWEQLELHPLASVIVTDTVKVPAAPAVTDTEDPVVEPTMEPLPLTPQE